MDNLLKTVIKAHGGWERWQKVTKLNAHVSIGGGIWHLKGWPGVFTDANVVINPRRQHIEFSPFGNLGQHILVEPDRVAIVATDGNIIEQRGSPRQAFEGHSIQTPWDALHLAYFSGYAMWGYLTAPYLFAYPGFHAQEIEPWDENGEIWRRLKVTFPAEIHAHCSEQVFYYDSKGLLRRNDYRVDIIGSGTTSAHYSDEHKSFGGMVFPTNRRVYSIGADNKPILERVLVSIHVHEVDVG
ncbi:hypothetical protein [Janthinobacterium agaricidamnosum]|uniref:Uncharacterized protein n=1 Tax=Janthinobacterium agaricidamnosum NBRC 102515 = DSM 9628 TaxID=1349767 RepID=W0V910_9BURK|nr:hypothetical protein [Janthinobacterium agaricidamnosum]CDG85314.1 putative uncharacterized protein [Janthinobacterium agaricidamnosum NBRC 102515 = DSM 9628]